LSAGGACGHGRYKARCPFHAARLCNRTRFRDQLAQGFGLMRVEMIGDHKPPRGRIKRKRALHVSHNIRFGPGPAHGGCENVSCRALEIGAHRLGARTAVGHFHAFHPAWRHGPGGMGPRKGLQAGRRIRAHAMYPVCLSLVGVVLPRADRLDIGVTLVRVRRPVMREPIPRLLRCQVRLLGQNARGCAGQWVAHGHV